MPPFEERNVMEMIRNIRQVTMFDSFLRLGVMPTITKKMMYTCYLFEFTKFSALAAHIAACCLFFVVGMCFVPLRPQFADSVGVCFTCRIC